MFACLRDISQHCTVEIFELCHAKIDLKIFVDVIPKEGLACSSLANLYYTLIQFNGKKVMRYSVLSNTQNRVILKKESNTKNRVILKNRVAHDLLSIALYMCVKSESSGVFLHGASRRFRYMFLALKKNLNC